MEFWQISGAAIAALCVALVLFGLLRLPDSRMSPSLLAFASSGALWTLGETITLLARDASAEQVGIAVLYTGSIFMPALWWRLVLLWAEKHGVAAGRAGPWARVPLLWASVMWLVMLANPWHGQFLEPVVGGRNLYRPLYWWMLFPNYAFVFAAGAVIAFAIRRIPLRSVVRQGSAMIAASGALLFANATYVFGTEPAFNATFLVLGASAAILVLAMYREGLFGVLPIALPVAAEHDPDGLVVVRSGGRVAWANTRARGLLGVDLSEDARFPGSLRARLLLADGTPVSRTGESDGTWWKAVLRPEGQLYRLDGEDECWLRICGRLVRGRSRRVVALCVRIRDVTDERLTQADLRRADRLQSVAELARGVAHDFRNMVSVVRGNAELLCRDLPDDPPLQKKLARILRAGERAGELAEQLQLYAGGIDPHRASIDLSELTREVAELQQSLLPARLQLELELHPEPLVVEVDPTQIRQALMNLMVNAREALSESGGTIRVQTGVCAVEPPRMSHLVIGRERPRALYGWVRVVDDGPGIDAPTQERIFEPFYSTKGKRGGIGLSTVLGIARAHEALLQLESEPVRGSAFALYFPIESGDPLAVTRRPRPRPPGA